MTGPMVKKVDPSFPKIKLVLLLKCHDLSGDIWEAIDDQLLPRNIDEKAKENFFKYINANQSQVLLILDGLDEAPSNYTKMFSDLVESRELPKCHIILTSRQEGSVKISKFCDTLFQMEGFASENSHNYIMHYFKDLEAQGLKLLQDIEESIELGELIANPLFTAMLCLVYEDLKGGLPLSKTQLYLEITECILKRFCQKQGLPHNNENLTEVYKEELEQLGSIALKALKKDRMHIEDSEFPGTTGKSPLFEFLSVQSNSSKRRSHTCYRFSHKSFQEFFAGLYLSDQILKGETDFETLLASERTTLEPVLLFTVGILGHKRENGALSLLHIIIKKANLFKNFKYQNFYLCFALKCIGECSTENSGLRSQMTNLLGTNLELQKMIISDKSFPIKLFVEALQVNSTLAHLYIIVPFFGDQFIVSLANILRVNKTLTLVHFITNGIVSAHGVQQLADSLMDSKTLNDLLLSGNAWGNDTVRILAGYLKRSVSLSNKSFHLIASDIGDAGATALAEVLRTNTTLNSLGLCYNPGIGNPSVMSLCEALKVNTTLSSLDLSGTGISDAGVLSLVEVLKTNTSSLTSLLLSDIKISHQSFKSIAEVLRVNSTLKDLKFEGNKVGVGGTKLIAESLKANTTLKLLSLSRNNIKAKCGRLFSDSLKVNGTLESLTLAENALGSRGAQRLSDGLRVNTSLRHLDLSWNSIGSEGAESIAETIRVNASLTSLKLVGNNIGDPGANKVSEALKDNVSLEKLDLSFNAIGAAGAESIAEALKSNAILTILDLGSNVIGDNGAQSLCEALKKNATLTTLAVSDNNIHSAGAQAFDELQGHNNTLKEVTLILNNIGDLGDHGDQEFNEVPMGSLSYFPISCDLSLRCTDQGSFDVLVSKETLMLPQQ